MEALDSLLSRSDDDVTNPVIERACEAGIEFHFGESALSWARTETGVCVRTDFGEYMGNAVFITVGREPITETAGLKATGVGLTDEQFVSVTEEYRTDNDRIFTIRDVLGGKILAHEAMAEAAQAVAGIAGDEPSSIDAIPAVVFTDSEIGVIGRTIDSILEVGYEPVVGKFSFSASGRTLTAGDPSGFAKLVATADTGRVIRDRCPGSRSQGFRITR